MRFKSLRFLFLASALTPFLTRTVLAGAWTLPKDNWYLEQLTSFSYSDKDFDNRGERVKKTNRGVYDEIATKSYVEYGINDRLNLVASAVYKRISYVDDYSDLNNAGFQDGTLNLKYRLTDQKGLIFSVGAGGAFPLGYDRRAPFALGKGKTDVEGRLYVSRAFLLVKGQGKNPGYSRIFTGLEVAKNRQGLPYIYELGYFPAPWVFGKFTVIGQENLPRKPGGEDFTKWDFILTLTSKGGNTTLRSGQALNLGVGYGQTFRGRNSGAGGELIASISFIF